MPIALRPENDADKEPNGRKEHSKDVTGSNKRTVGVMRPSDFLMPPLTIPITPLALGGSWVRIGVPAAWRIVIGHSLTILAGRFCAAQ